MLETREIEVFLAVASELHFGRAAERLRLSPSRVSQTVRALERQVGGPLFERTSRTVRLTPLGEQLLAGLRPAYERLGQVLHDARVTAAGQRASLTVGFSASLTPGTRETVAGAFEVARPGSRVVTVEVNPMDMFLWDERVGVGLDAIVAWLPPGVGRNPTPALTAGPVIRRTPPALLMSQRHPLADRSSVDVEELADLELLYADGLERLAASWVPPTTPSGRPIHRVRREVRYFESLVSDLTGSRLIHLTIGDFGLALPMDGLVLVPLTGRSPFDCRTVWLTTRTTPAVREFARLAANAGVRAGWV